MVLEYYEPHETYTWDRLDQCTGNAALSAIVYTLVGLSAVWQLGTYPWTRHVRMSTGAHARKHDMPNVM